MNKLFLYIFIVIVRTHLVQASVSLTELHKRWWLGDTACIKEIMEYPTETEEELIVTDRLDFLHQLCFGSFAHREAYLKRSENRLEPNKKKTPSPVLKSNINAHQAIVLYLNGRELECYKKAYKAWVSTHAINKQAQLPIAAKSITWIMAQGFSSFPDSWMAMLTFTGIANTNLNKPIKHTNTALDSIFLAEHDIITKLWMLISVDKHHQIINISGYELYLNYPVLQWIVVFAATKFRASAQLDNMHFKWFDYPLNTYAAAEYYLQRLETEKAEYLYTQFLNRAPTDLFRADAMYKLAICRTIHQTNYNAVHEAEWILKQKNFITEADKRAKLWAKTEKYLAHAQVLKLRLLIDGGYFKQADSLVRFQDKQPPLHHTSHQLEYTYRKARLMDFKKDTSEAALLYAQVIKMQQKDLPLYYAPFSCVRLAQFYRKNNRKKARYFAYKALGYSNFAYRKSIERAAFQILKSL